MVFGLVFIMEQRIYTQVVVITGVLPVFFASPIMNSTPYCKGLNWIIRTGSDTIDTMWITVGTWMSGYVLNKSLFSAK